MKVFFDQSVEVYRVTVLVSVNIYIVNDHNDEQKNVAVIEILVIVSRVVLGANTINLCESDIKVLIPKKGDLL